MDIAKRIAKFRKEAGRRTPPKCILRLIEY